VDALDTAIIMRESGAVNDILTHIKQINWDKPKGDVSLFETTIRYLGGMLSGYDLLESGTGRSLLGPGIVRNLSNLSRILTLFSQGRQVLLDQSIRLANRLAYGFTLRESGIPSHDLQFPDLGTTGQTTLADVGTLILEWTRLSDLSKNATYSRLAKRAQDKVMSQNLGANAMYGNSLPGLLGGSIDLQTGKANGDAHWGGGADSYYEYLMKMFVYDARRFDNYGKEFANAASSAMKGLTTTANFLGSNSVYLTQLNPGASGWARPQSPVSSHLTCFAGGSYLLGSAVLGDQQLRGLGLTADKLRAFGLQLVEGCYKAYLSTQSGIAPEAWYVSPKGVAAADGARYYILRPEVLESIYYAYRVTGDRKYQDWSWELFSHIRAKTRTNFGFTAIDDVTQQDGGRKSNNQESFFFAETLKYAYMIHADVVCPSARSWDELTSMFRRPTITSSPGGRSRSGCSTRRPTRSGSVRRKSDMFGLPARTRVI
jgi:mannosyl-oligosaccharide alpha-1,2-mannosidase